VTDKGMLRVTNGRIDALIVPSSLEIWQRSGWGLKESTPPPPAPPQTRPRARASKRKPAARHDSAETLEADEPEMSATTEE
jgi:hypothetical protein